MGIFSRLADIINANLNSLLDRAEDPAKLVRLIVHEMEESLVRERANLARYLADKKELSRQSVRYQQQQADWQAKAELALQKGREDLARAALIERGKRQQLASSLEHEMVQVDSAITKLTADIAQLESKLLDARARQQAMVLRSSAAESRLQVQQQQQKAGPGQAMEKFERMERRIEEMEANADLYHPNASLQQQFAELEADDEIARELARMKASLQTGGQQETQ